MGDTKMPKWLYRFQTLNVNNLLALQQNKLWFSSVDKFNDPFEFFVDPIELIDGILESCTLKKLEDFASSFGQQKPSDKHLLKKEFEDGNTDSLKNRIVVMYQSNTRRKLMDLGVCCFFQNISDGLSWAHYADSHQGYAFAIEVEEIDYQLAILEVKYASAPSPRGEEIPGALETIVATKSEDWKHEEEWRICSPTESNVLRSQAYDKPWPIKKVYFGGRMNGNQKKLIQDATKNALEYYDAIFEPENYIIRFELSNFETVNVHHG